MKLTGNPFVVRFARTGFRRGKGSFHIAVIGALLGIMLVLNTALLLFRDAFPRPLYPDFRSFSTSLFYQLFAFNAVNLFVLGPLRIYAVSMRERTEGTLEFLSVSTLRPASVVWGMVGGQQLSGILFFTVTLPVSVICTISGGVGVEDLCVSYAYLFAASILLSLVALHTGLRVEKRNADALIVLFVIFLFLGTGVLMGLRGSLPGAAGVIHFLNPIGIYLGFADVRQFRGEIAFFGYDVQPIYAAMLFYGFIVTCLTASLNRYLRMGQTYRSSLPWALAAYVGILVFSHGLVPSPQLGVSAVERSTLLVSSLFLLFYVVSGRLIHGELYLLKRGFDPPGATGRHPFRGLTRELLPFAAVHVLSDAWITWLGSSSIDLLPSAVSLVPVIGILLASCAVELGSSGEPRTPKKGVFWLAVVVPVIFGVVAGAVAGSADNALLVMGASPPVLAVLLVLRDADFGGQPDIPGILNGALACAALFTLGISALGFLSWKGHHMRLEKTVSIMQAGASEAELPRGAERPEDADGPLQIAPRELESD